jgi:hypothetical protein
VPTWTVDDLLARVKRKCQFPTVNAKLTDAEIVQIIDEEIQTDIYAALQMVRSEYCVAHRELTYPADARYVQLPSVLASSTFVDVWRKEPDSDPPVYYPLTRAPSGAPWNGTQTTTSTPSAFAIEGDRLALVQRPAAEVTLLLRYERRPSRLHLVTDARSAPIVSYNPATFAITITPPTGFATTCPVGTTVDIVRATPSFDALVQGMEVSVVASPVWTLITGDIDHTTPDTAPITQSDVNVGDYLTLTGETPIFPLPEMWLPVVLYAASAAACREVGDMQQGEVNEAAAQKLIERATSFAAQRVRKAPIAMFDRGSPLRGGVLGGAWSVDQLRVGWW